MNKRIKIERPEDLREGMRVEVEYLRETRVGKVYKGSRPSSPELHLDGGDGTYCLVAYNGRYYSEIESIYRLIDGIEDVVVGDPLRSPNGVRYHCAERLTTTLILMSRGGLHIGSIRDLAEDDWTVDIENIAEQKGVEPEDIVIKKDE